MVKVEITFESEQGKNDFLERFRSGGFEDFTMGLENEDVDYFELDEDSNTEDSHAIRVTSSPLSR